MRRREGVLQGGQPGSRAGVQRGRAVVAKHVALLSPRDLKHKEQDIKKMT